MPDNKMNLPQLSNEDQIKIFALVKQGNSIEDALERADELGQLGRAAGSDVPSRSRTPSNDRSNRFRTMSKIGKSLKVRTKSRPKVSDVDEVNEALLEERRLMCVICGGKIAVTQASLASRNHHVMHRDCKQMEQPQHPCTTTPSKSCSFFPKSFGVTFRFRDHVSTFSFSAATSDTGVEEVGIDYDGGTQLNFITDDDTALLWPTLIAAFGAPRGMTMTFSNGYDSFVSHDKFVCNSEFQQLQGTASFRIYGLDHTLVVALSYQLDDCYVSPVFATLNVTPCTTAIDRYQLECLGALDTLEDAANVFDDQGGDQNEEDDAFSDSDDEYMNSLSSRS
eukprot:m.153584 g.153584  ORF g.153584 m.153584 type:complete len:337 (-) comp30840_c0_seq1:101-1111(-)